jgi:ubiquinone/menaquinone biosynthesis C-methylase UbiE
VSAIRSFDRLARIYQALEYVAFGRALERARFAHLDRLQNCRSILVTGEGDGRCLERLLRAAPQATVDCLDLSPAMLARASARLAGQEAAARVTFRQADLLTAVLPAAHYDAVVTLFFLDCFTALQMEVVMARLHDSLEPGAVWLWADFNVPAQGLARLRARLWLGVLYAFFRWQTGLPARELPPVESFFAAKRYEVLAERSFQQGLLRSVAWRRPKQM